MEDDLAPARGIINGLVISMLLWAAIIAVGVWLFG